MLVRPGAVGRMTPKSSGAPAALPPTGGTLGQFNYSVSRNTVLRFFFP